MTKTTFKTHTGDTAVLEHTGTQLLVSVGNFGNLTLQSIGTELRASALRAGQRMGWVQPRDTGSDELTERQQELAHNADFDEDGEPLWF